jgi:hypothetical protein
MATNIGGDRPLRVCDLCGGVDDHPRHVLAGGEGFAKPGADIVDRVLANAPADQRARLVDELLDTHASDRHMDCCRTAGCPDGTCNTQTAGAENLRGGALLTHLESLGDEQ